MADNYVIIDNKKYDISLTILDLCYYNLTNLPPEICALINLTILNLYNNTLTILPPEIGALKNVTVPKGRLPY